MDGSRFDELVRGIAARHTRRSMLRRALGFGGAVTAAVLTGNQADARTIGARPTIPPPAPTTTTTTPAPTTPSPDPCPGLEVCAVDGCCDGLCTEQGRCCAAGRTICGLECCATADQCCDGECCADGSVCTGEEGCCPAAQACGTVCLEPGQCCSDDSCPDSEPTCQIGFCDPATRTCQFSEDCSHADPGSTCCGGVCVMLGTVEHCAACNDRCSMVDACTPAACENGSCRTISNCPEIDDCTPGLCHPWGQCSTGSICTGLDTCGGGGEEEVCGCTPIPCEAETCAHDGCGGSCGQDCPEGYSCFAGRCFHTFFDPFACPIPPGWPNACVTNSVEGPIVCTNCELPGCGSSCHSTAECPEGHVCGFTGGCILPAGAGICYGALPPE